MSVQKGLRKGKGLGEERVDSLPQTGREPQGCKEREDALACAKNHQARSSRQGKDDRLNGRHPDAGGNAGLYRHSLNFCVRQNCRVRAFYPQHSPRRPSTRKMMPSERLKMIRRINNMIAQNDDMLVREIEARCHATSLSKQEYLHNLTRSIHDLRLRPDLGSRVVDSSEG